MEQPRKREERRMMGKGLLLMTLLFLLLGQGWSGPTSSRLLISAGVFSFSQENFRTMYGTLPVMNVELETFLGKNFGFSVGLVYLSGKGQALVLSGEPDQMFKLEFSRRSVPLCFKWRIVKGSFEACAAVGGVLSFIREKWSEVDLAQRETKFHLRYEAGVNFKVVKNVVLLARVAAENIASSYNSPALYGAQPNLGGLSFQAGLGYHFKWK